MASSVEVLSEQRTQNWLKSNLAMLFARQGLPGFVTSEFHKAHQRLLKDIYRDHNVHEGTLCTSCKSSSIEKFQRRHHFMHFCPNNMCHFIMAWIRDTHKYANPTWKHTDVTKWTTDPLEICKCFLPPGGGYRNVAHFEELDLIGLMLILINCRIFTEKLQMSRDILNEAMQRISNIRRNVDLAISDDDFYYVCDALLRLLQDVQMVSTHDIADEAKAAASKIQKLKSDTMPIATTDLKSVLDEGIKNLASSIPGEMEQMSDRAIKEVLKAREMAEHDWKKVKQDMKCMMCDMRYDMQNKQLEMHKFFCDLKTDHEKKILQQIHEAREAIYTLKEDNLGVQSTVSDVSLLDSKENVSDKMRQEIRDKMSHEMMKAKDKMYEYFFKLKNDTENSTLEQIEEARQIIYKLKRETLASIANVKSDIEECGEIVKLSIEQKFECHLNKIKSVSEDERRKIESLYKQVFNTAESHTKTEKIIDDDYHDDSNKLIHKINDKEGNVLTKINEEVPITVLLETAKQKVPRSEYISLAEFSEIIASSKKQSFSSLSAMKEKQTAESSTLRLRDIGDAQLLEKQELESADDGRSGNKCIICYNREKTCIIKPCNHYATCLDCFQKLNACPCCRGKIERVVELSSPGREDMSDEALVKFKIDEENCEDKQIIARRLRKRIRQFRTIGELPDQTLLNELCSEIGRRSKVVARVCDAICNHIKTLDDSILHVWASYVKEDENKVIFVVLVRENVRLEKKIKYSFIKRIENEYSFEAKDVMCCESRKKYSLPQNDLEKLKETISKNAPELMKRHTNLSVISGSSVRSRNYGIDPINALELVQEACIVLYVSTKRNMPIDEEPFEKYYDGVAVDVMEGEFVPFVYAEERQDKLRLSCQIGSSPDSFPNQHMRRVGSLGCFIDHPEYRLCALTCAHVLLFPTGLDEVKKNMRKARWPHFKAHDVVYQPPQSNDAIGHLVQVIYDEGDEHGCCGMEVALFQIDQRHPESGEFPTMRNPENGQDMTFDSGKSCGFSCIGEHEAIKFGPITDRTVGKFEKETQCTSVKTIVHDWKDDGYEITLNNQLCVLGDTRNPNGKFADHGDSGSLVFIKDTRGALVCVGIVEGGTSYGATVVTPIKPILQKLGVSEIKSFDRENVWKKLTEMDDKLNTIVSMLSRNPRS